MEFAAIVVAMALNLLTASQPLPDFGLDPGFFKTKEDPKYEGGDKAGELTPSLPGWSTELKKIFLQLLPSSVKKLEQTPWDQLLLKVYYCPMHLSRIMSLYFPLQNTVPSEYWFIVHFTSVM